MFQPIRINDPKNGFFLFLFFFLVVKRKMFCLGVFCLDGVGYSGPQTFLARFV